MAMVTKLAFVPAKGSLHKIIDEEPLSLIRGGDKFNPSWRLQTPHGERFIASVDYKDVVFKFECFGIFFRNEDQTASPPRRDSDVIPMYSIGLLFRAEWEELGASASPPGNRMIARRFSGSLERIDALALSACVSLIGIAWASEPGAAIEHALTIDVDGDNPTALTYSDDHESIKSLIADCNVVSAISVDAWEDLVSTWTSEAGANARSTF